MKTWRVDCGNCGEFDHQDWKEPFVCPMCKLVDVEVDEARLDFNLQPVAVKKVAKELAIKCIDQFFSDKMFHCGGSIPKRFLHDPNKVAMVLNFNIIKGVDKAYEALEKMLHPEETKQAKKTGNITNDIKIVNETLNLLSQSKVPIQFAGGMMIMYLEFVEGIDFE